jgi:hypothetical protein
MAAIPQGFSKPASNQEQARPSKWEWLHPESELCYRKEPALSAGGVSIMSALGLTGVEKSPEIRPSFKSRFPGAPELDCREQFRDPAVSIRGVNY